MTTIEIKQRVEQLHTEAKRTGQRSRHLLSVLDGPKRGRQITLLWGQPWEGVRNASHR